MEHMVYWTSSLIQVVMWSSVLLMVLGAFSITISFMGISAVHTRSAGVVVFVVCVEMMEVLIQLTLMVAAVIFYANRQAFKKAVTGVSGDESRGDSIAGELRDYCIQLLCCSLLSAVITTTQMLLALLCLKRMKADATVKRRRASRLRRARAKKKAKAKRKSRWVAAARRKKKSGIATDDGQALVVAAAPNKHKEDADELSTEFHTPGSVSEFSQSSVGLRARKSSAGSTPVSAAAAAAAAAAGVPNVPDAHVSAPTLKSNSLTGLPRPSPRAWLEMVRERTETEGSRDSEGEQLFLALSKTSPTHSDRRVGDCGGRRTPPEHEKGMNQVGSRDHRHEGSFGDDGEPKGVLVLPDNLALPPKLLLRQSRQLRRNSQEEEGAFEDGDDFSSGEDDDDDDDDGNDGFDDENDEELGLRRGAFEGGAEGRESALSGNEEEEEEEGEYPIDEDGTTEAELRKVLEVR
jgi:hypothetical protein